EAEQLGIAQGGAIPGRKERAYALAERIGADEQKAGSRAVAANVHARAAQAVRNHVNAGRVETVPDEERSGDATRHDEVVGELVFAAVAPNVDGPQGNRLQAANGAFPIAECQAIAEHGALLVNDRQEVTVDPPRSEQQLQTVFG